MRIGLTLLCVVSSVLAEPLATNPATAFPGRLPIQRPEDRPLSAAMERVYNQWGPDSMLEARGLHDSVRNELLSNFLYSRLQGFDYSNNTSRRDPSKVLRIDGTYYVWYTHRNTVAPPSGPELATDTIPSADWDLAEIWYATSRDGFTWEEQGVAIARPPKPEYGWRSVATPDVLAFKGKYYLYYQGFNDIPFTKGGDRAAATVAEADSPRGPWRPLGHVVLDFGAPDEWDADAIHDPFPLVYQGKIYLYYKGQPLKSKTDPTLLRAWGVATADNPLGPFTKSPFNPIMNSGHETCLFPWKGGVAALTSLDGPEKNTIQFAPDGINFKIMTSVEMPPLAPGPFVPDAFADNGDGRGITWGLCHIPPTLEDSEARGMHWADNTHYTLARFDCDLSRDVERPEFKRTYPGRYDETAFFSSRAKLPEGMRSKIKQEASKKDHDTIANEK